MKHLEFLGSFELNHPEIDDDHRQAMDMINAMMDQLPEPDVADFTPMLDDFVALITAHFDREERILRKLEFPKVAEHAAHHKYMHANLVRDVADFKASGDTTKTKDLVASMPDLLIHDILKADIQFKSFLTEKLGASGDRA